MFCKHCGKEISDDAYLCVNCGKLVKDIPENTTNTQPQTNGMAIAGFVCSFFIPILGWIFGGIGLAKSSKRNGKGKGLSISAIIIATIATISFIFNYIS